MYVQAHDDDVDDDVERKKNVKSSLILISHQTHVKVLAYMIRNICEIYF